MRAADIIIGVCHAAPLEEIQAAGSSADSFVPFVSADTARRTDPARTLPGAKSVIVVGVGEVPPPHAHAEQGFPQLSSLGTDEDYHMRVKAILRELVANLKTELKSHGKCEDFRYKIIVDGGGLDERALAVRAGLGFIGRSGLVISEKFGSRFNIGVLLTTVELSTLQNFSFFPNQKISPEILSCPPTCSLCINSCPTNALGGENFNAARCVSYLTQKDELTAEEEEILAAAGQIYGCDICRDICPFNKKRRATHVNPNEWLAMTDEDFREKYGHTAMLWRGTEILRRNARILSRRG